MHSVSEPSPWAHEVGALFCSVALLLGGCTVPATPASSPVDSQSESVPARPGIPPATTPSGGGARAAPAASVSPADPAAEQFWQWIAYETDPKLDPTRNLKDNSLLWGRTVCSQTKLGVTRETALELLRADDWSTTSAEAIIKGALNALCPERNTPPYATAFDGDVRGAVGALQRELPWSGPGPEEFDVGWFAKSACGYLRQGNSINGFEAHLHSHRVGGASPTATGARLIQAFGTNDAGLRKATSLVVRQTCFDVHHILRYHWNV
jgi:hypothetical protein